MADSSRTQWDQLRGKEEPYPLQTIPDSLPLRTHCLILNHERRMSNGFASLIRWTECHSKRSRGISSIAESYIAGSFDSAALRSGWRNGFNDVTICEWRGLWPYQPWPGLLTGGRLLRNSACWRSESLCSCDSRVCCSGLGPEEQAANTTVVATMTRTLAPSFFILEQQ